jgi:hypothetical protein
VAFAGCATVQELIARNSIFQDPYWVNLGAMMEKYDRGSVCCFTASITAPAIPLQTLHSDRGYLVALCFEILCYILHKKQMRDNQACEFLAMSQVVRSPMLGR